MRTATIILVLLTWPVWLPAGCAPDGLVRHPTRLLPETWCDKPPLAKDPLLTVFGPGTGHDPERILAEARKVLDAAGTWLALTPGRFNILVFSPDDPEGQALIDEGGFRHRAAGKYLPGQRLVLVAGDDRDHRFWQILRHETVHALTDTGLSAGVRLPLWFMEGTAALFEQGTASGEPLVNRERLALMRYRLARDPDALDIRRLARKEAFSGDDYARAWAVAACLHQGRYPVAAHLRGLGPADVLRFEDFLEPGQSIGGFSKACSRRLLSPEFFTE